MNVRLHGLGLAFVLTLSAAACSSSGDGASATGTGGSSGSGGSSRTGGSGGSTGGSTAGSGGSSGEGGAGGADASAADAAPTPDAALTSDDGASVTADGSATGGTGGGADASAPVDSVGTADAGGPTQAGLSLDGVATWRGNATGVYTLIHDDVCDPSVSGVFTHADPELTKRDLHAGFGAIVDQCGQTNAWAKVKTLLAHGHDVFNHSWSHPCLGDATQCDGNGTPSSDYATQVDKSTKTLEDMLSIKVQYFIFPYDVCGVGAMARIKQTGYLGARCGGEDHGVNDTNFTDPFANKFDIWGPSYSTYGKGGPCAGKAGAEGAEPTAAPDECRVYVLNHYVDEAIRLKGWANREVHGFTGDPGVWQAMPLADYTAHLDYVASKVKTGELWAEGPTPVIRYRFAREACAKPTLVDGTLKFGAPSADCTKYATTLSYLVTATGSDPAALSVKQGAVTLPGRKLGAGKFVVDADPTKGDATIVE